MKTLDPRVLDGNHEAITRFVDALTPIIQARVARQLAPSGRALSGDLRQDVKDLTQDIFAYLFGDDAKALRRWDAALGLSLANYVGLIAERRTISALRSGRSNPWREEAGEDTTLYSDQRPDVEHAVSQEDQFQRLLEALKVALSPQGWHLFDLLYIKELGVEEVCRRASLSADAVYAWRSRLRRTAREKFQELDAHGRDELMRTGL